MKKILQKELKWATFIYNVMNIYIYAFILKNQLNFVGTYVISLHYFALGTALKSQKDCNLMPDSIGP